MTTPIYSGECWLKSWSDSSRGGRTVTLQIEEDGPHQFKGYEGERFAIVVVPIGNDDKPMAKTSLVGEVSTRKADRAEAVIPAADALRTSPTKPKKRWHDMPASQRAALLVKDAEFQRYATECYDPEAALLFDEAAADEWLKLVCGISTKTALDLPGPSTSNEAFAMLEGNFRAWQQAKQLGAA